MDYQYIAKETDLSHAGELWFSSKEQVCTVYAFQVIEMRKFDRAFPEANLVCNLALTYPRILI